MEKRWCWGNNGCHGVVITIIQRKSVALNGIVKGTLAGRQDWNIRNLKINIYLLLLNCDLPFSLYIF